MRAGRPRAALTALVAALAVGGVAVAASAGPAVAVVAADAAAVVVLLVAGRPHRV